MLEYKFTVEKCRGRGCGQKLSGKKVELEGMKGPIPMGRCPKCGLAYPLVEVKSEVEPAPEPKPEPEPEPETPTAEE